MLQQAIIVGAALACWPAQHQDDIVFNSALHSTAGTAHAILSPTPQKDQRAGASGARRIARLSPACSLLTTVDGLSLVQPGWLRYPHASRRRCGSENCR